MKFQYQYRTIFSQMGCSPSSCFGQSKSSQSPYLQHAIQPQHSNSNSQTNISQLISNLDRDQLLEQAHKLLKQQKVREAKEYFQTIIAKKMFIDDKIIGVGCCEQQVGHYEHNTIQWYFQSNKNCNEFDGLSLCYLLTKQFQEAEAWYKKQLTNNPNDYRLLIGLAHIYFNSKQYQLAVKYYQEVIKFNSVYDKPYQILAAIYKILKRKVSQIQEFAEKALVHNSKNIYAALILALIEEQSVIKYEKIKKVIEIDKKYGRPYNALGNILKKQGDTKGAVQQYKKCIKLAPRFEAPYIGLANIYREKKMYSSAIDFFKKSLEINQKSDISYNGLANIYNELDNFEKAVENYSKSIEINPNFAASYYGMGIIFKKQRKYQEAKQYLLTAIRLDNQNQLAYQALGSVYFELNEVDKCLQICKKCLSLNPNKSGAHFEMGRSYLKKQDIEQAKIHFHKALELQPNCVQILCAIGNVHYREDQYEQALHYYNKCLQTNESNENNEWVYYSLAKLWKKQKQYEQAEKYIKKCLQLNARNHNALNVLGNIYSELGKDQQAIQFYLKSIECNPRHFTSHYNLGNAYFILHDYQNAIKAYSTAIELDKENYHPYNGLGNCYKSLNQLDQAIEWYQKAIAINPDSDVAYYGLGNIYSLRQDYDKAEGYFELALQKNSTNTLCTMNLGMVYLKIQNFKKAFELINKAKENIEKDERLTTDNQSYLAENIRIFQEEAEEWQIKRKTGFISQQSRIHLNTMIGHFEEKVKCLYTSLNEAQSIKRVKVSPTMLRIINLLFEDKFKLVEINKIFHEVHSLFLTDQEYFHIIPLIFCQFFWSQKFLYNKPIADIEKHLTSVLKQYSQSSVNKNQYSRSNQSQFNTIVSLKGEATNEKVNLFKDTQYFPSYEQLYSQIKIVNGKAAAHFSQFKQLVALVKKQSKGFGEQLGLKLPESSKNQFKVMLRLMEKMFKEIRGRKQFLIEKLDQILSELQSVDIETVIHEIVKVWTNQIDSILQNRMENKMPTPCYISDLVRGKIMFNKVSDIQLAVLKAQQYCKQRQYIILQCQNRLQKPQTRDVVLKIQIKQAVCQLQLAFKQNLSSYHFDHSIYQILRSPLGCIFGSYVFMSRGFKYPFIQHCKDIRDKLKKNSSLKDRVIARKVAYIIAALETQRIPFKVPEMKRSKSGQELEMKSSPIKGYNPKKRRRINQI